jgi:hypothetical protein
MYMGVYLLSLKKGKFRTSTGLSRMTFSSCLRMLKISLTCSLYRVKEDEMGSACSTNGEKRNAYRILMGNPEGKRPLGRPRRRWVDNIKILER